MVSTSIGCIFAIDLGTLTLFVSTENILWKNDFLEDWLISCIWLWPWKWTRFWKSLICFVIPNNYINKTFINISRTYIGKHFLLGQFESLKMEIDPKFNIYMKYELGKWVVWGAVPPGGGGGVVWGWGWSHLEKSQQLVIGSLWVERGE